MENNEVENINSEIDETETLDSSNEEQVDAEETQEAPKYSESETKLYARAKKAEGELKELKELLASKDVEQGDKKTVPDTKEDSSLSPQDIIALTKADVDSDDITEVLEYAKFKGISVQEALKSTVVKTTLSENSEKRKSAQAVNTGSSRRASGTISDERLLADAKSGKMPESEEDIARLSLLRMQNR